MADSTTIINKPPIVCFSHLAWDTALFQRPQQIMSRLAAAGYPVYYFACVGRRRHLEHPMNVPLSGTPGVSVYTLQYAPGVRRFAALRRWTAGLRVAAILRKNRIHKPIIWYYHPLLFALGYSHADAAIIYDVMDHFSSFEETRDDLYFEELTLLAEADIIFTGGRSLDRHTRAMMNELTPDAKSAPWMRRPSPRTADLDAGPSNDSQSSLSPPPQPPAKIHCFPSGVDLDHFGQAIDSDRTGRDGSPSRPSPEPPHEPLPVPRFGYFGAIDERIDWDIIRTLANATGGSVILAGPILRPPPDDLPSNVHLPGAVAYAELPALLATFDVCLIPFRNTPLVQYVSPTKTPEYFAGGKPVVSTPIPDVVADYGDIVRIAATPVDFTAACLELSNNPPDPETLIANAKQRARTWDEIVAEMDKIISGKIESSSE